MIRIVQMNNLRGLFGIRIMGGDRNAKIVYVGECMRKRLIGQPGKR